MKIYTLYFTTKLNPGLQMNIEAENLDEAKKKVKKEFPDAEFY